MLIKVKAVPSVRAFKFILSATIHLNLKQIRKIKVKHKDKLRSLIEIVRQLSARELGY